MPFAIKVVGNEPFLYSSDFPHEVTNESCKHDIAELMESGEIAEDDKAALLYRNAERFYKLPLEEERTNHERLSRRRHHCPQSTPGFVFVFFRPEHESPFDTLTALSRVEGRSRARSFYLSTFIQVNLEYFI